MQRHCSLLLLIKLFLIHSSVTYYVRYMDLPHYRLGQVHMVNGCNKMSILAGPQAIVLWHVLNCKSTLFVYLSNKRNLHFQRNSAYLSVIIIMTHFSFDWYFGISFLPRDSRRTGKYQCLYAMKIVFVDRSTVNRSKTGVSAQHRVDNHTLVYKWKIWLTVFAFNPTV